MRAYGLDDLLHGLGDSELLRLARSWCNGHTPQGADAGAARRALLSHSMRSHAELRRRCAQLGDSSRALLRRLVERGDHCLALDALIDGPHAWGRTPHEVETALADLESQGWLFRLEDRQVERFGRPALALASEVAAALRPLLFDEPVAPPPLPLDETWTLKGFLARRHARGGEPGAAIDASRAAQHARQAYKLFLMPAAVGKRIARLPEDVRDLVETAMSRFGGLLPRSFWVRTRGDEGGFGRPDLGRILEDALLGRVARLDLRAHGIDLTEDTLVVFQEVALVWLRQRTQAAPPAPETERVAGVDLATNVMRFLRYVDDSTVRYTAQGEIFRATQKRILTQLVTGEGEDADQAFRFIYRFALSRRLVEPTGERTLRLSETGRTFEARDLPAKLEDLLAFAVDDASCGGDPFHQVRMRRTLLRLLRRLEPGIWHDAMYVPFLARNHHLAQLEASGAAGHYEALRARGRYVLREDLVQLAWRLFTWVRTRLHLLGIVDLGYAEGRPVALRLSPLGASLLQGVAVAAESARSTLVVNPDFEILLFPEGDAFELVHTLDRFSRRTASDRLYRFELSEGSVRSALADGMGIAEVLDVLGARCRTPLPQNVLFSLLDWSDRAGAVWLDGRRVIGCRKPEMLERLLENPHVRDLTRNGTNEGVRLREGVRVEDFRAVLRDLGFFLELRDDGSGPRTPAVGGG